MADCVATAQSATLQGESTTQQKTPQDEEAKETNKMDTTFYIADTPGPAILGLPSCRRLRIVNLNCSGSMVNPLKYPWKGKMSNRI